MKIIEFWAPWCAPCKISKAAIASLRASGDVSFEIEEINADEHPELVSRHSVRSLPTMIILADSGEELGRQAGAMNKAQIISFVDMTRTQRF